MRTNKAIDASGEITELPIEQILPEDLQGLLQGRASGKLTWKCDSTGKVIDSDGDLELQGLQINNISVLKQLAALGGNEDLKIFPFQQATADFHLHKGRVTLGLHAVSAESIYNSGDRWVRAFHETRGSPSGLYRNSNKNVASQRNEAGC